MVICMLPWPLVCVSSSKFMINSPVADVASGIGLKQSPVEENRKAPLGFSTQISPVDSLGMQHHLSNNKPSRPEANGITVILAHV